MAPTCGGRTAAMYRCDSDGLRAVRLLTDAVAVKPIWSPTVRVTPRSRHSDRSRVTGQVLR
jgi:hypothetical protein